MIEVFSPVDGMPYFTTRFLFLAKIVAWATSGDYEYKGKGWI